MKLYFVTAALYAALLSSCNIMGERIRGNGDIKTEQRTEGEFRGLDVSGAVKVYVKQDPAYSVKVEADANLQQYVQTRTSGQTLVIKQKSGYNLQPTSSIKVYVSGPQFSDIAVSGASHIYSEGRLISPESITLDLSGASSAEMDIKAPRVDVELTGASQARLTGETRDLLVQGTGASKVKCFGLLSEKADVDLTGASTAEVFASVELRANVTGASHVHYKGNAAITQKSVSGAASVKKEE